MYGVLHLAKAFGSEGYHDTPEGRLYNLRMEGYEEAILEYADDNCDVENTQLPIGMVKPSAGDGIAKQRTMNSPRSSTFVRQIRRP